jgi:hypothetical protein
MNEKTKSCNPEWYVFGTSHFMCQQHEAGRPLDE